MAKVRALGGSLSERVERLLAQEIEAEIRRRADARLDAAIDGSFTDEFNEGLVDQDRDA